MNHTKAFTLIELLVVIAIIAILAAILFPVFAQAKASAKRAADLSNVKQTATALQIYLADSDDTFPLGEALIPGVGWTWDRFHRFPAGWDGSVSPEFNQADQVHWANSIQPYMKNMDLLMSPGGREFRLAAWAVRYDLQVRQPKPLAYTMNGYLSGYVSTAVAAPSQLIAIHPGFGNEARLGASTVVPALYCRNADQPCRYVPTSPTCSPAQNGSWGIIWGKHLESSYWVLSGGMNVAFADTSARFRRLGANIGGRTDFRTDPYSEYSATGHTWTRWKDSNICHALLFRPDFDFSDFGTPVAGW